MGKKRRGANKKQRGIGSDDKKESGVTASRHNIHRKVRNRSDIVPVAICVIFELTKWSFLPHREENQANPDWLEGWPNQEGCLNR